MRSHVIDLLLIKIGAGIQPILSSSNSSSRLLKWNETGRYDNPACAPQPASVKSGKEKARELFTGARGTFTLRPESEMKRTPEVPASIRDEALFDCTKPS